MIFTDLYGFEVDTILKNISLKNPSFEFVPGETLIFFDEIQDCINFATSLKAFREDGRYDVICSGSLDEEVQEDLRNNKNFNTYKGDIYENIVGDMLVKAGYQLYFYRNEHRTLEIDFMVRDADSLVPIEVKANDSATASLNALIEREQYSDIKYGVKLANKNIGFNGKFYTFPYFLGFLLKRFLKENNHNEKLERFYFGFQGAT